MLNLTLEQIKNTCLDLDLRVNRLWQLYINDEKILQANGTNPRIRQLKKEEIRKAVPDLVDKAFVYEVRIIKNKQIQPKILSYSHYQLSFDEGLTKQDFELDKINESTIQDYAWKIYLIR